MKRCIALLHHGWADWEAGFVLAALREHFGFTGFRKVVMTQEFAAMQKKARIRAHARSDRDIHGHPHQVVGPLSGSHSTRSSRFVTDQ
jgi:hypothetical protein